MLTSFGNREPRYRSVPDSVDSHGPDAISLAKQGGLTLDPWQQDVLIDAMGVDEQGNWTATEVGVIVPRQNGKGAILEALCVWWLLTQPNALILWSAHEFKTAREAFLRVKTLIENSSLNKHMNATFRVGKGEEAVEAKNGSRLRFVARSQVSGRGFSGDLIILDEAFALTDDQMAALMPTLSARKHIQIWYTSSAPLLTSGVLRTLCKQGREGIPKLAYFEWCAEQTDELDDRDAWAKANPALGYRITEEFTENEMFRLDPEDFQRERLGVWLEDIFETVVDLHVWGSLVSEDQSPGDPVALAFDISPDRRFSAICAASLREDGTVLLEVIDVLPGTGWIVPRLVSLVEKHQPCVVMVDSNSPATSLLPDLVDAGLELTKDPEPGDEEIIVKTTMPELVQACGLFYDSVIGHNKGTVIAKDGEEIEISTWGVRHLDDEALNAAIEGAAQRPLGDAWAWSRKSSVVNIAPLVAVTLAVYGLAVYGRDPDPEPFVFFGR